MGDVEPLLACAAADPAAANGVGGADAVASSWSGMAGLGVSGGMTSVLTSDSASENESTPEPVRGGKALWRKPPVLTTLLMLETDDILLGPGRIDAGKSFMR